MEPSQESSLTLTNTVLLARRQELERAAAAEAECPEARSPGEGRPGLLAMTERLRQGISIQDQADEQQRIAAGRDQDTAVSEQDALLRMRQSVSSTLNDPTLVEDTSTWLWESAADMYDYWPWPTFFKSNTIFERR